MEMLNVLEGFNLAELGHNSPEYVHHLVEAMRLAYRDRAKFLADPDFANVPVERLTSKEYASALRETIDVAIAAPSDPTEVDLSNESTETTHYSVVDSDGMAVAVTYTLEAGYGSKITVPRAGFLLNNEMGDFNGDRVVGPADAAVLAAHWGPSAEGTQPVPEPVVPVLLMCGVVGSAFRRGARIRRWQSGCTSPFRDCPTLAGVARRHAAHRNLGGSARWGNRKE